MSYAFTNNNFRIYCPPVLCQENMPHASKLLETYFYDVQKFSIFENSMSKLQGLGYAIQYFAQGTLYKNLDVTEEVDGTIEVQFIAHFINNEIQPYIDISSLKLPDGNINIISTQTKFYYDIGDIQTFKVIATEGIRYQNVKYVNIRTDTSNVREINIYM